MNKSLGYKDKLKQLVIQHKSNAPKEYVHEGNVHEKNIDITNTHEGILVERVDNKRYKYSRSAHSQLIRDMATDYLERIGQHFYDNRGE